MDELTLLANALMALDDKLAACMKCGMCQSVCPVFGETMMEADVTRGKLTLLEKLAHRLIEDPDAVNEKLNRCLLCGSCQANCPSGVSILEIFMEARAIVAAYTSMRSSFSVSASVRFETGTPVVMDTTSAMSSTVT